MKKNGKEISGFVFGMQGFSIHDGPGIRTTVFLKGCDLYCPWCHNPEGLSRRPELSFSKSLCIGCGACASVCSAHTADGDGHHLDRALCTASGKCIDACPTGALSLTGERMKVSQVVAFALRDRRYYGKNGGVTLSGGEPMCQPEFTAAVLRELKQAGIHTALETNGTADFPLYEKLMPDTDLFLIDYKLSDPATYAMAGSVLGRVPETISRLDRGGAHIVLRCPIIPGVNDNRDHFSAIAALVRRHANIIRYEIMPYHKLGVSKAERHSMKYRVFEEAPASAVSEWKEIIHALITGRNETDE